MSIICFIKFSEAFWYLRPSSDDDDQFPIDASRYAPYLNAVILQICEQALTGELYNWQALSRSPGLGFVVPPNRVSGLFSNAFWSQPSGSRLMFGCALYGICT